MALEPYDPCPCGSGRKFKFCCQPISEQLHAVERLIEERQPKQALVAAEKLEPQHATNPLLMRYKISALLMLGRNDEALKAIRQCEEANPQDPYAYYFDITWHLRFATWEETRPLLEVGFGIIAQRAPELASQLAQEVTDEMLAKGCYMAAWRYLYDGLILCRSKEQIERLLGVLGELNGTAEIPLPFRSPYHTRVLPDNQPHQAEFAEAVQFTDARNWTKAAQLFEALSEKDLHQPVFSYNAGLCYAWSGDLAAASELLGRAAEDVPDFEEGVQLETLAQLHEQMLPEEQTQSSIYRYRVKSISRLLSQLDQEARLFREPSPPSEEGERPVAASYFLLNHPANEADLSDLKTIAVSIGSIVVMDEVSEPEIPGEVFFRSTSAAFTEADRELILRIAGEHIDTTAEEGWGQLEPESGMPRDISHLNFNIIPPPGLRMSEVRKLKDAHSRYVVYEQWTQTPLSALDDRSPVEAAQDPDLHLPVCAAINVMACLAETVNFTVDVDELRKRLNLPPVEPFKPQTPEDFSVASIQDYQRMAFMDVPVEQLPMAFQSLAGARAMQALRRLLEAMYVREVALKNFDTPALCRMGCGLATRCLDLENAQTWIDRGRESAQKAGGNLMTRLEWDMTQLEVYALAEKTDQLIELLRKCAREYFVKVPECKSAIQMLITAEHLDNPQVQAIMNGSDLVGAGVGPGGLWTPESASGAPSGKLWMPGQE